MSYIIFDVVHIIFDVKSPSLLVSRLTTNWIDELYGSFISDKPVDVQISEIRTDRRFNREITGF
jgi:hypothetical protein